MTIPNVTTPTTQLDHNNDQLPGNDVTDSAREQILDAVQKLNDIINQYGGAEMITSANLDANNVAQTDQSNVFTEIQTISNSPAELNLKVLSAANGRVVFKNSNDVEEAHLLYAANLYAAFDNLTADGGGLTLWNSGLLQLIGLGVQIQMTVAGDIILMPKSGQKAYIGSTGDENEIATKKNYGGIVDSAGNIIHLPSGWGASRVSQGRYRILHGLNLSANGYSVVANYKSPDTTQRNLWAQTMSLDTNSFDYLIRSGSGDVTDGDSTFLMTVNQ